MKPASLNEFLSYWDSIRHGKSMPGRQDIDPGDIPAMLPFVFLVDVVDEGDDFRYRLVGTDIVRNTKMDYRWVTSCCTSTVLASNKITTSRDFCCTPSKPANYCRYKFIADFLTLLVAIRGSTYSSAHPVPTRSRGWGVRFAMKGRAVVPISNGPRTRPTV